MEIGKNFYQYQIQALDSESNIARDWLAKHQTLARKVKIKQVKNNLLETENQKIQLRTIASQSALLQHSHIQLLYDYLETSQGIFFVYEHFEGENLENFLKKNPNEAVKKSVFIQIIDALAYSHRQGIVHLNLNPHNIWINQAGQVMISDFGFALFQSNFSHFTSPEQKQSAYTDARSDIFTLGKILAYLFPNPSEHIKNVVQKACQIEAYRRYQTCEAMKADLLLSFYVLAHQEEKKTTPPITYAIWIVALLVVGTGLWFLLKNFIDASKRKPKEITFNNNSPVVIKDTVDYNKIAQQRQEEEKLKKEKDERTPEQKEKDSLNKIKKEKKEAREKRAKERKERVLKNVIVDGQFISNTLGEYKINVEIFNSNKDTELQELIILISYYNAAGDLIDKEEKIISKIAANEATAVEVNKKINAARFTCKIKDAKLPPDPNDIEEED
ncbi:MAG: hypothetical protein OHK0045_05630 [Raineya sp.]